MIVSINLTVDDSSSIVDFTASPETLYAGGRASLAWDLAGNHPVSGQMSVAVQESTVFILNIVSAGGQTIGTLMASVYVSPKLVDWPTASKYWGVIANANDAISSYLVSHPTFFAEDTLVTDLEVGGVNYADPVSVSNATAAYNKAAALLATRGIMMGTYISGTNVILAAKDVRYPHSCVRFEDMPLVAKYLGVWPGQTYRQFIDPSDVATRVAHTALIGTEWAKVGVQIPGKPIVFHFIDNAASLEGGPYGAWADQMANVQGINALAQSLGCRCIFNMSIIVGRLSAANLTALISALGNATDKLQPAASGICLENPFPTSISSDPAATAIAVSQYRQLLDAGVGIVMIGGSQTGVATPAQLRAWAATWRKPTDPLYLTKPFFKAPDPLIYDWSV